MKIAERPVALVTGGTRGIGLGICRRLAEEGYDIATCGRRPLSDVGAFVTSLEETGKEVLYVPSDIGIAEDRARLIDEVRNRFGRLDLLVNNAGMAPRIRQDILQATEDVYEEVLRVNLQGPYFLTQLAARWMAEQSETDRPQPGGDGNTPVRQRSRSIIFITSISSTVASPNRGEYCISKAGLSMATRLWAVRLAEFNIGVYEIRPGIIATDMTSGVKDKYDKMIADGLMLQPRWGEPEDIGKAVASLARGDWGYSTGQAIYVDGGITVDRL